jgi:hypothetical protein
MGISVNTANKETTNSIKLRTAEHPKETSSSIVLLVVSEKRNKNPLITLPRKERSTDPKKRGQNFKTVTDQSTCRHYVIDYKLRTHTFIMFS